MTYLLLASALSLSAISAYYSIVGLMAIFAAAKVPIAVMGGCLEFAKIVLSTWLKLNWKTTPIVLRTYFVLSIVVLMLITSAGIFGFLSKAHLDQGISFNDNVIKIQEIDRKIAIEQQTIKDATLVISQLDQAVQSLIDANRIRGSTGSIAVRKSQNDERASLSFTIKTANESITVLQAQKLPLQQQQISLEAEVGPIKYVASLFYDSTDKEMLEKAVIVLILMFIFTFDPLAILMFVAVANSVKPKKKIEEKRKEPELEPIAPTTETPVEQEEIFHVEEKVEHLGVEEPTPTVEKELKKDKTNSQALSINTKITASDSIEITKS